MIENRKVVRRWELLLFLPVVDTATGEVLGRVADITKEGIMLFTQRALPLGQSYDLEIRHADLEEALLARDVGDSNVRFQAVVRWQDENPTLHRAGMQFEELSEETSLALRNIVRNVAHNLG